MLSSSAGPGRKQVLCSVISLITIVLIHPIHIYNDENNDTSHLSVIKGSQGERREPTDITQNTMQRTEIQYATSCQDLQRIQNFYLILSWHQNYQVATSSRGSSSSVFGIVCQYARILLCPGLLLFCLRLPQMALPDCLAYLRPG